ncbi:MAG: hypothetical protein L0219_03390, partial [Phycisphaerales bacterium]|nr:hypothetical protein [Phycisphaerales bacterium]
MRRADFREFAADRAMGQVRVIAIAAEMPKVEVLEIGRHDFDGQLRRGVVGEMAVPADDALLDAPRAARVLLQ